MNAKGPGNTFVAGFVSGIESIRLNDLEVANALALATVQQDLRLYGTACYTRRADGSIERHDPGTITVNGEALGKRHVGDVARGLQ